MPSAKRHDNEPTLNWKVQVMKAQRQLEWISSEVVIGAQVSTINWYLAAGVEPVSGKFAKQLPLLVKGRAVPDKLLAGNCSRSKRTGSNLKLYKSNMRILGSHRTAAPEVHRCGKPDTLAPCGQKPSF
jgi:hypothetical protein